MALKEFSWILDKQNAIMRCKKIDKCKQNKVDQCKPFVWKIDQLANAMFK